MEEKDPQRGSTWIIGYGNSHRKDDGIGPYVVERISRAVGMNPAIALRSLQQLDPVLAEDVRGAGVLILVDATVESLEGGLRWIRIHPKGDVPSLDTHHLDPSHFAGLLESLYRRTPTIWLVSVEGRDFGFGEGLSPEAQERAERAGRQIVQFCLREGIDNGHASIHDTAGQFKVEGERHDTRSGHPYHR